MGNTTLTGSRGWEPERRPPVIAAAALKARSIHTPKNCYTALLTYLPTGSSRLRHLYSKRLTYLSIFSFLLSLLVFSQPRRFICVPLFPNLLSAPTHFTPPPSTFPPTSCLSLTLFPLTPHPHIHSPKVQSWLRLGWRFCSPGCFILSKRLFPPLSGPLHGYDDVLTAVRIKGDHISPFHSGGI